MRALCIVLAAIVATGGAAAAGPRSTDLDSGGRSKIAEFAHDGPAGIDDHDAADDDGIDDGAEDADDASEDEADSGDD